LNPDPTYWAGLAAGGQGLLQLGAIPTLAGLDLSELGDEFPGAAVKVGHDGLALGVEAEARVALLIGRHPVIGDELAEMCGQCCSPRALRRKHTAVYRLCILFSGADLAIVGRQQLSDRMS